uniref:RNase H type-1 domain-containing protein n=1 Tax=Knipowitschia caucasica TaxID=637954 RepID=A0AAV2LWW2_KNICA
MKFAIEEINNSSGLLPGVTLGYNIFDHCSDIQNFPGIFNLLWGKKSFNPWDITRLNFSKVISVVGTFTSPESRTVAPMFMRQLIPMFCNCSELHPEDILKAANAFTFPVYAAVYAIAHALHNTLQCGDDKCSKSITAYPHMVLSELKRIVFLILNHTIKFDQNGDLSATLVLKHFPIVVFCFDHLQVPSSLCSPECLDGHRRMDPYTCLACEETEWSPEASTSCNQRSVEFVPFEDVFAIVIMVGTGVLLVVSLLTALLFGLNYNTPVVRSAGGPMCFLILGCLSLCSISVFFYFVDPYTCLACEETEWSPEASTSCNQRSVEFVPFEDVFAIVIMVGTGFLLVVSLLTALLFGLNYNTPVCIFFGGGCVGASEYSQDGDYIIGGLFNIHWETHPQQYYTPEVLQCSSSSFYVSSYRRFQLMKFAIEEINNSSGLLPGVTLGYNIFDHCSDIQNFPDIFNLLWGKTPFNPWDITRLNFSEIIAVVGSSTSHLTRAVAPMFMNNLIPMISYAASISIFSLKHLFPSFFRTVHTNKDVFCNCSELHPEDILKAENSFNFPVYAAVYAIAHALHNTLQCGDDKCSKSITAYPHMVLSELKRLTFMILNRTIQFDQNGDLRFGHYDIITWNSSGEAEIIGVHTFQSPPVFFIDEFKVHWHNNGQVPSALCMPECPKGYRRSVEGIHKCCYTCIKCQKDEYINNSVDPYTCLACGETEWSPEASTSCNQRSVEFVPFEDVFAIVIMVGTGVLLVVSLLTALLFGLNYNTPVDWTRGGARGGGRGGRGGRRGGSWKGGRDVCHLCYRHGHWARDCPFEGEASYYHGAPEMVRGRGPQRGMGPRPERAGPPSPWTAPNDNLAPRDGQYFQHGNYWGEVEDDNLMALVDTGATYSTINTKIRPVLLSEEHITLVGFSGTPEVPAEVWSQGPTDVGLCTSFPPVSLQMKPGGPIRIKQNAAKPDAVEVNSGVLTDKPSAQAAELEALCAALEFAKGKSVNIYSDSAYATQAVHFNLSEWKRNGFLTAKGRPITHRALVERLDSALQLPKQVSVIKCQGHSKSDNFEARGNEVADEAAKKAANYKVSTPGVFVVRDEGPDLADCLPDLSLQVLAEAQTKAAPEEISMWVQKRAKKDPDTGIWYGPDGRPALPMGDLSRAALSEAHGLAHVGQVEGSLDLCEKEASEDPPAWVRVKVFKRKWNEPRWTGPFEVVARTRKAVQLKGHGNKWFHLSHTRPSDPPS